MGVAIFAARKIALLNSINNLEMMRMQISSQQQALSDQACSLTMEQGNIQISALSAQNNSSSGGGGSFGQLLPGLLGGLGSLIGGQEGAQLGALGGSLFSGLLGGGSSSGSTSNPAMTALQQENIRIQQQIMMIQQQEKRLEATAKQLETQLGLKNREYESVEKAEENAIKRSAPKYGE